MKRARRNTPLIIWTVVLLIAALIAVGYALDSAEQTANNNTIRATDYLLKAREAYGFLVDMETSQRGYLISRDTSLLVTYDRAVALLPGLWQQLEADALNVENPPGSEQGLRDLVVQMKQRAERWQREIAEPQIALVRAGAALETFGSDAIRQGKEQFDECRAAAAAIDQYLNERIQAYTSIVNRIGTLRLWLFLGLGVLALGIGLLAMSVARRESRLQEETALIAENERERLQTIIENLPLAVRLLAVPDGNVLIQNRVAEELFPAETWNRMKPGERISYFGFRKSDGAPLMAEEAPVMRSLQQGVTVQDYELQMSSPEGGSRIMLTSAAPLRDEKGRITAAVTVMQDVTEMRKLDRRKDEFIATAAHELRSPLTTISGYQQLLVKMMEDTNAPSKVSTYLEAMGAQVSRLNALVERLLDASRIQLGRLVLEKSHFDLVDLAHSVASSVTMDWGLGAGTSSPQSPVCKLTAPQGSVEGEWDMTRIEQVLTNLVGNAVRYSPPNTPVEIVVEKRGNGAHVRVIDRGPGVPPEQRLTLFDRYSQGGTAGTITTQRKRGSLGLGLYLSSEIVKAHGGTIGMEPNPEGGSIFWFTLP